MLITGCPKCGYALASANWRFSYRVGTRERTLCAGCGFDWAARAAVLGTAIAAVGVCQADTTVTRQRKPVELLRLEQEVATLRLRLGRFRG